MWTRDVRPPRHEDVAIGVVKHEYVSGRIELDELERRLEDILWRGKAADYMMGGLPVPPPKPSDAARSARPPRPERECPACAEPVVVGEPVYVVGCDNCAKRQMSTSDYVQTLKYHRRRLELDRSLDWARVRDDV